MSCSQMRLASTAGPRAAGRGAAALLPLALALAVLAGAPAGAAAQDVAEQARIDRELGAFEEGLLGELLTVLPDPDAAPGGPPPYDQEPPDAQEDFRPAPPPTQPGQPPGPNNPGPGPNPNS